MKDRRKRNNLSSWSTFFWCTLVIVFSSMLFTTLTLSPLRLSHFSHPLKLKPPTTQSKSEASPTIQDIVLLPEQALIFLNYPHSFRFYKKSELHCIYFSTNSTRSEPQLTHSPIQLHPGRFREQMIRCPLPPREHTISLLIKSKDIVQTKDSSIHNWEPLVYDALFDHDNTTIVFVKGLNLRPERLTDPSRFQCLYGLDFTKPNFFIKSNVVSAAQEIIRCKTPKSILTDQAQTQGPTQPHSIKVSIEVINKGVLLPSIARPGLNSLHNQIKQKAHNMCVCTMLYNQAHFIKEWIMYHTKIGVQRWFIYDNNSNDDIENVISFLQSIGYNVTQHLWPWVKTQEAGFAHCALRARASCEWVGFIDVDEFFNVKIKGGLDSVIWHYAKPGNNVAEIRTPCYSFGPSGLREVPQQGMMVGYTCRLGSRERHKSIVRPEALNQSLINVVHHFHLGTQFVSVDAGKGEMMINHYKYQVWKVFKEKFNRRVATYVADWKDGKNVGSKDRVPGLGTRAVEPEDWANRFCEVRDMRLRNWVLMNFLDRRTRLLPWQREFEHHLRKRRKRKWKVPFIE